MSIYILYNKLCHFSYYPFLCHKDFVILLKLNLYVAKWNVQTLMTRVHFAGSQSALIEHSAHVQALPESRMPTKDGALWNMSVSTTDPLRVWCVEHLELVLHNFFTSEADVHRVVPWNKLSWNQLSKVMGTRNVNLRSVLVVSRKNGCR